MRFTCPSCAKSYRLPPERLGPSGRAQISCPNCKAVVLVKAGTDENLDCQLLGPAGSATGSGAHAPVRARPASGAVAPAPATWFVVVDREKVGPLTPAQIAEKMQTGALTIHSLAWQKGMTNWSRIEELPELLRALGQTGVVNSARQSGILASDPQSTPDQAGGHTPGAGDAARAEVAHPPASQASHQAQPAQQPAQPAQHHAAPQPAPRPAPRGGAQPVQQQVEPKPVPKPAQRPSGPKPTPIANAARDDDDAGPTLEAAIPVLPGRGDGKGPPQRPAPVKLTAKPAPMPQRPAPQGHSSGQGHDAHGDAFFGKSHDLGDIELSLPDPNKHKPTKEEYQNLIQEFSVMFRLDKRTKRQKVLIGVVLASLLVGAVSFGVVLTVGAERKKQLIKDSKQILALFDLGYKQAVTPTVSSDSADAADPNAGAATAKKEPEKVSMIADKIISQVAKKRKAAPAAPTLGLARHGQVDAKAEEEALEEQRRKKAQEAAAIAAAQARRFGIEKVEERAGVGLQMGEELSQKDVSRMCREKEGVLRGCAKKQELEGPFKLKISIVTTGKIDTVSAMVDGKANSALASCIRGQLSGVRLNAPKQTQTFDCSVD